MRKKRQRSIKTIKRSLWKYFSAYIKLRDAELVDGKLVVRCISCGKEYEYGDQKINAGHFFSSKGSPALRYNPFNVHAQCVACNINQGEQYLFYKGLLKKYKNAKQIIYRLEQNKKKKYTFKKKKLEQLEQRYKRLFNEISRKYEIEIKNR